MKVKSLLMVVLLSVTLCGCAGTPHIIGYDIAKPAVAPPDLGKVTILPFDDARPQEERKGVKGKTLTFSSKDKHFSKPITATVKEVLTEELNNIGFSVVEESQISDYQISGSLKHFQAIMAPSKITFVPYLGALSTVWAKDEFTLTLSIYVKMTDESSRTLIDKTFDVSEDMKLPTGLLSLARYRRGFNYKLKLLDEALKDVLGQIRDEVAVKAKR